ncbi:MAG: hypothetical protein HC818_07035 [Synechococcaceae cyanobacterium RM1_1_27]|nr:hypothetical protein [Synechococcaceae cyanobacterium SM2_3_2]NJO86305.1 hypothetical protein [Synechococcaceae cyanobacterium RM1_1_27]
MQQAFGMLCLLTQVPFLDKENIEVGIAHQMVLFPEEKIKFCVILIADCINQVQS